MVGRFVENEQIGHLQEKPGEEGACLLAAAQVCQAQLHLLFAKAQPLQYLPDAHIVVVATGELKPLKRSPIAFQQVV